MFFKDIIGQDEIKRQLIETAQKGVVPHARMFCGTEGTGSFQLAMAYARYLNCTERSDTDSCGHCKSCLQFNELAHPDLHFVFPMISNKDKKKTVCDDYITEWREFLKKNFEEHSYFDIDDWLAAIDAENKQALIYSEESDSIIRKMSFRIYEAQYRILFVWMPERMHAACANKLLKLIEEPPANTAILMVTNNPDMVLGTIYSRSQIVQVKPISTEILTKSMKEIWNLDDDNARNIAHIAGGNYLKAVRTLEVDNDNAFFLEQFKQIMRNGWKRDIAAMKTFAEEMAAIGRERAKNFLAFAQRQIRENFVRCLQAPALNYQTADEADFSKNFAPYVNERNIIDLMEELSLAERHIAQNINAKMVFFDLSMRITALVKR